jgi:hypothetical protein
MTLPEARPVQHIVILAYRHGTFDKTQYLLNHIAEVWRAAAS